MRGTFLFGVCGARVRVPVYIAGYLQSLFGIPTSAANRHGGIHCSYDGLHDGLLTRQLPYAALSKLFVATLIGREVSSDILVAKPSGRTDLIPHGSHITRARLSVTNSSI